MAGETVSFGAGNYDAWVLKLDGDGNVQWQKTYGGSNGDEAYSIQQTTDGGYVIGGTTHSFGYDRAWVLKLDGDGNVQWQKTYGRQEPNSIQQTTDGGYIVAGRTWSFDAGSSDAVVLKLDGNGNIHDCPIVKTSNAQVIDSNTTVQDTNVIGADTYVSPGTMTVSIADTNATVLDTCSTLSDIAVSPTSYDFSFVDVGNSSETQTFTISNTGTKALLIDSIALTGDDAFQFSILNNNCSYQILPLLSCLVEVLFSPTSLGVKSAVALTIQSDDPDTPTLNIPLSGTGGVPNISVSPTKLNFGVIKVGSSSAPSAITIFNSGSFDLRIADMTLSDTVNYSLDVDGGTNPCGSTTATITPNSSCTVTVTFSPTWEGTIDGSISISSNDPDTPTLDLLLSGTAFTSEVSCSLTPSGATRLSRGSNLKFYAFVQNNTDEVQVFQFATKVTLPNGNMYPSSGWLLGPDTFTLNPLTSNSKLHTQFIPYNAPFGTYTYRGYVGTVSPRLVYDKCEFTFSVNP